MNTKSILLTSITLVLCALLIAPMPAKAEDPALEVFEVDTLEDLVDYLPNGICSAGYVNEGPCSLRAAVSDAYQIMELNKDLLIRLPYGTYTLTQTDSSSGVDKYYGDLDFVSLPVEYAGNERTVTIEGTGDLPSVIDANGIDRVMEIGKYYNIILKNVIITGGYLKADYDEVKEGGGIYKHQNSTLELDKVRVTENELECVNTCQNTMGGGISSTGGTVTIKRSEIDNNLARVGSAIDFWSTNGYLIINTSAIHSNSMDEGRVIAGYGRLLNLINSTVEGEVEWKKGDVWVQNSTLFINQIPSGSSAADANIWMNPLSEQPTLMIKNSILITQFADDPGSTAGPNCRLSGLINQPKLGGNVFSDGTCGPGDGDVRVTDPRDALLGPLGNNGGRTPTRALLPGSPAINICDGICEVLWGDPSNPSSLMLLSDQRGVDRDRKCDSGAYEFWHKQYLPIILK